MKWYENNILIATIGLTLISIFAIVVLPEADKVVNTAIGTMGGFIVGAVTTKQ